MLAAAMVSVVVSGCGSTTTLTPDQIVPAFISASQDDARTLHMEWQGSFNQTSGGDQGSGLGQVKQSLSAAFDFNGPDYAGSLNTTVTGIGPSNEVAYARVSGVAFINYANSGWQRTDTVGVPTPEMDPLRGLDVAQVAYEAADTLDGRAVHRLRVSDPLAALNDSIFASTGSGGFSLVPGGRSDFLVYVDASGIPLGAKVAVDVVASVSAKDSVPPGVTYAIDLDFKFSLWGEPVTISPPQISGAPRG